MSTRSSGHRPSRISIGSHIPIPCRNCGVELIPFVVTEGTSKLWCGACKMPTQVVVSYERDVLRIKSQDVR